MSLRGGRLGSAQAARLAYHRAPFTGGTVSLNFAALDVETANSNRGSICSFGVCIVTGGEVSATHHLLTQPPPGLNWFDGFNTSLHGIGPDTVADQPQFSDQLVAVLDIVGELPVIAHNAAFDIGAVRMGCVAAQIDWPAITYACSLVLSRRAGLQLLSYRLPFICQALGIPTGTHHRADQDAEAAARLVVALAERQGMGTLPDLAAALMVRLGTLSAASWAGCIANRLPTQRPQANADADPDHPLFGKLIAFTGGLSITRAEASAMVAVLGATPQQGPTKHTDFLVIGDGFTGHHVEDFHTGKALAAAKANAKKGHIEVLTEGDLLEMLAEPVTSGDRPVLVACDEGYREHA